MEEKKKPTINNMTYEIKISLQYKYILSSFLIFELRLPVWPVLTIIKSTAVRHNLEIPKYCLAFKWS